VFSKLLEKNFFWITKVREIVLVSKDFRFEYFLKPRVNTHFSLLNWVLNLGTQGDFVNTADSQLSDAEFAYGGWDANYEKNHRNRKGDFHKQGRQWLVQGQSASQCLVQGSKGAVDDVFAIPLYQQCVTFSLHRVSSNVIFGENLFQIWRQTQGSISDVLSCRLSENSTSYY